MKKLFVILSFFPFWGLVSLFAQSSVSVVPITADYSATPPTVTFEVSWPAGSRDANYRSKVWVLVDYRRIKDNAYTGDWLRAGISSTHTPITNSGAVSLVPGNAKGFWLQGTAGAFAATVTVPVTVNLTGYAPQFAWCGVASDRPPTAIEYPGYYALQGTQPFIIQTDPDDPSQTVIRSTTAYDDCIYALTDSTGCPGEPPAMPKITDFTASTTAICAGESVTLTATAANAERYSFDNGVTWGSSSSTVVSPLTPTTYILKATREKGACTVTFPTQITVTVNDPPTPHLLTADPLTVCSGEPATLTASATGAASYSLNGSTWTESYQLTDYPETTTTYTLYIKSAEGCMASLANAATITVDEKPTNLSLTSATYCNGEQPATLTATPAGAASYSLDNTNWQPAATFEVSPTTTTTYTLYVQNAAGCIAILPGAATVTVNDLQTNLSLSSATICNGQSATLTASASDATSYRLDNTSWQAAATFEVSPTATTTYTLYVQSAAGCTATLPDAATVTVNDVPATPTDASSNTRCGSGTLAFSATVPDGITIDWYTDPTGGSSVATGNTYTPDITATGVITYYAEARKTATGCMSATRLPVSGTVHGLPTITLASGSNAQTVTTGSTITVIKYTTTHATGANLSNQPDGVSGVWTNNTYTISGTPSNVGIFNYTVTTTNSNSCANATANGTITVIITGCIPATLNLGTVGFTSEDTWTRNGITVSSPVTATYCNKTAYDVTIGPPVSAACRTGNAANYGHVFSWCLVMQYAKQLCPDPWRVPSLEDINQYAINPTTGTVAADLKTGVDGWISLGYARENGKMSYNDRAYYWTSSRSVYLNDQYIYTRVDPTYFTPEVQDPAYFGYHLRCVR